MQSGISDLRCDRARRVLHQPSGGIANRAQPDRWLDVGQVPKRLNHSCPTMNRRAGTQIPHAGWLQPADAGFVSRTRAMDRPGGCGSPHLTSPGPCPTMNRRAGTQIPHAGWLKRTKGGSELPPAIGRMGGMWVTSPVFRRPSSSFAYQGRPGLGLGIGEESSASYVVERQRLVLHRAYLGALYGGRGEGEGAPERLRAWIRLAVARRYSYPSCSGPP